MVDKETRNGPILSSTKETQDKIKDLVNELIKELLNEVGPIYENNSEMNNDRRYILLCQLGEFTYGKLKKVEMKIYES